MRDVGVQVSYLFYRFNERGQVERCEESSKGAIRVRREDEAGYVILFVEGAYGDRPAAISEPARCIL